MPRILEKKDESQASETGGGKNKIALVAGVLALILGLFGAVIMLGGDQNLLRSIGFANPDDVSSGRIHFWTIAVKIFFDYPILGAGLDAFGVAFTRYDTWHGAFRVEQAHNEYLQILADAGVAGFLCVAAFVYLLFKKSAPQLKRQIMIFGKSATRRMAGCFAF